MALSRELTILLHQRLMNAPRLVRYFFVGGLATVVYMIAGMFFDWLWPHKRWRSIPWLFVLPLWFLIRAALCHLCPINSGHSAGFAQIPLTNLCGLGLNTLFVALLLYVGVHYYLCMPVASLLVPIVMYPIQKKWLSALNNKRITKNTSAQKSRRSAKHRAAAFLNRL